VTFATGYHRSHGLKFDNKGDPVKAKYIGMQTRSRFARPL
jgi:hypothetical protein